MDLHQYGTFLNEKASQAVLHHQYRHAHRRICAGARIDPSKWMSSIDDSVYLSSLTIPGTHDSAAYGSSWPFVSTQTLSIDEQLASGIRYFDLRCGLVSDELQMVHGQALLNRTLVSVLDSMYTFLTARPSEALIVQIKQDRLPTNDSTMSFADALWSLVRSRLELWLVSHTTPTLGRARGRIQLFRRFHGPPWIGIDVSKWPDNPVGPIKMRNRAGVEVVVQDHYSPSPPMALDTMVEEKMALVSKVMDLAASDKDGSRWYLNFCSAYQFNFVHRFTPYDVAVGGYIPYHWVVGMNPRLVAELKQRRGRKKRYGITLLDYLELPQNELVGQLIATNFEPRTRNGRTRKFDVSTRAVLIMALVLFMIFVAGSLLVSTLR